MQCQPCCRGHRQEAYRHEEAKAIRQLLLQLQGLLFPGSPGPGQRRIDFCGYTVGQVVPSLMHRFSTEAI